MFTDLPMRKNRLFVRSQIMSKSASTLAIFVTAFLLSSCGGSGSSSSNGEEDLLPPIVTTRPNIVFFLVDDLGWTDVGIDSTTYGHASDFYQTPNLARLAARGMSFNNAYASGPNCAPTRAAILTGQYPVRPTNNIYTVGSLQRNANSSLLFGVRHNENNFLPGDVYTMPEMLKTQGYITAHIGKYHVGKVTGETSPGQQGFDFVIGNYKGRGGYFSNSAEFGEHVDPSLDRFAGDYSAEQSLALTDSNVLIGQRKHLTDAFTEAAIDFIIQAQASSSSPFFLHIGHRATHNPVTNSGRPDLVLKYNAIPDGDRHNDSDYAALVEGLDQSLGQIMSFLKSTEDVRNQGRKLIDTTMIVFYSDNGGVVYPSDAQHSSNRPLRGGKSSLLEGGIRVPLIIALPGLIEEGSINETPVTSVDFYRTFAEIAEVDLNSVLPDNYPAIDGESLVPVLDDSSASLSRDYLFWHFPGHNRRTRAQPQSIIRNGRYKLVYRYEIEDYQLFNVVRDLGEENNLIDVPRLRPMAVKMSRELRRFLMESNAPLPTYRTTGETVNYPYVIEPIL
jgi:arylsulfatase A-like enzyme